MANILNRESAFDASIPELMEFLKEHWDVSKLVFEGTFTTEGVDLTHLRGIVTDVTIEGKHVIFPFTDVELNRISVRKSGSLKNALVPGRCRFSCFFAPPEVRRERNEPFLLSINLNTLRNINDDGSEIYTRPAVVKPAKVSDDKVAQVMQRLRLSDRFFIGQFSPINDDWIISDLRNIDFTKIEDKERGVKNPTIRVRGDIVKGINKYAYYKFGWVLLKEDPLKFGFDAEVDVVPIYPKDIVRCLHDSIVNYPPSASRKITRMLDTLNKQLTQSGKEVFIYELLQNANDYPRRSNGVPLPVCVEFHITDEFLMFEHSGDYFNAKNIAAICDINDGEKSENIEAIGYKGIGFKTVFLDNDYVYLHSGNYSFRFENNPDYPINTPWQILPVWTERRELDGNIINIFQRTNDQEFRVKFALRPRDKRILSDGTRSNNYVKLFKEVFETERVILFIPNIQQVKIFFGNKVDPDIIRSTDSQHWCVSSAMVDDVPEEVTIRINEVLDDSNADKSDGYDKVPEKYRNFKRTSVKFACQKDGRTLLPVDNAHLYCYLPAKKADWGFKFLMNTDMVPNGERDDIEDIELNHEIAKIAGRQFYYWIKELISCGQYELDSIFNLIPDFNDCINRKSGYSEFIEEFRDEFEELIKNEPFVPCIDENGDEVYATIDDIINDETGISAKGFMNDTDFIQLSNTGCANLPINELRQSDSFHAFLYRYSPQDYDFTFDCLKDVVPNDDFKEWLEDEKNDTNFICHLLDEGKLIDFKDEEIFIEAGESLFCSEDMYVEFEPEMSRIKFLSDYIPYLSPTLRAKLEEHDKWNEYADSYFREFEASDMLREFILNDDEALEQLKDECNSIAFFKFAAEKNVDISILKDISFFDEDGDMQSCYEDTYFYSPEVYELWHKEWIPKDRIYVLSHAYFDEPSIAEQLSSMLREAGIREFKHEDFIIERLVKDTDFASEVNELITDDYDANLSFVSYTFNHRDALNEKDYLLKDFTLRCVSKDNEDIYLNKDDVRYFTHYVESKNGNYEDYSSLSWIDTDMMYALHKGYIESVPAEEQKAMESFLRQKYGVKTLTDKSFWADVVSANRDRICRLIDSKETALSFIQYLADNDDILFDGSISFNELKGFPLLHSNGTISNERNLPLYAYDPVAGEVETFSWYQQEFYLLDSSYSELLSPKALQLLQIEDFNLQSTIDALCQDVKFDDNVQCEDFWRWVRGHSKDISDYSSLRDVAILQDGSKSWACDELYIPDAFYPIGEGIEALVRKFDSEAKFIPQTLMEDTSDKCKAEWLRFLKKLGAKSDNKAILHHVLLNIGEYEDEAADAVLALLTQNRKDITEKWEDNKASLQQLKVRTRGGEYRTLNDCIIVKIGEGDAEAEPFKYIILEDEVAPDILKANQEIILQIAQSLSSNHILEGRISWAKYKIDEYIYRIQNHIEERNRIHVQFVQDLAKWGNAFELDRKQITQILFRSKGTGMYLEAKELTLGSSYKPACNFEKYSVDLNYLSDTYLTEDNKDIICDFFKNNTDVHHRFEKEDIGYMSNREFAIYIWTVKLKAATPSFSRWIEEGEFNGIKCIPTALGTKEPEEVYSPVLKEYVRFCDNYTDKLPAIDISRLDDGMLAFMKLPFKTALDSKDCLAFLLKAQEKNEEDTKHREQIINWLLENDDLSFEEVQSYRKNPNAKWKNGRGQYVHISELYAIHPSSIQERSVFSANEHIIRTWSFPDDEEQFENICDMLDIRVLKSEDFSTIPIPPVSLQTAEILEKLKVRLLILAAIDHEDRYAKYYEKYLEKITAYNFFSCSQIEIGYGDIHGTVGRTYVDETDSKLYYVTAWDNQRTYTKFCHTIKQLVGIRAIDEICEEVFDESMSIEALIDKYCYSLRSDKVFLKYMEDLKQRVLAVEELISTVDVEEMKYEAYDGDGDESLPTEQVIVEEPKTEEPAIDEPVAEEPTTEEQELVPDAEHEEEVLPDVLPPANNHSKKEAIKPNQDESQHEVSMGDVPRSKTLVAGEGEEVVSQHYRSGTWVNEYYRSDGTFVPGHYRSDAIVSEHTREIPVISHTPHAPHEKSTGNANQPASYGENTTCQEGDVSGGSNRTTDNRPRNSNWRREPHNYSKEELENMRSNGSPLELTTLPPTDEEIEVLTKCNVPIERIADANYVAQLRLYRNLCERGDSPIESLEEFIQNAADVTEHRLHGGKYIHSCSAARGVLYISPTIWNKVMDESCAVCVYYGPHANMFFYINTPEDLLKLVEKDDVVIKITGKEKVNVVGALYNGLLKGVKGTAYTLIRVAAHTDIDAVFARYVGAMAEKEDGNEPLNVEEY